jgi:hypothetical protein
VDERLARLAEANLQVHRLEVGDYQVQDAWRFERKTVRDFVVSLADGTLCHWLFNCRCSAVGMRMKPGDYGKVVRATMT